MGDLFKNPGLFVISRILDMPDKCPHCKQDFKMEPGFYTAALWISYPMVLFVFIPLILVGFSLDDLHGFFKFMYPLMILISFLLQIPIMRISRAILLNMTISYFPY